MQRSKPSKRKEPFLFYLLSCLATSRNRKERNRQIFFGALPRFLVRESCLVCGLHRKVRMRGPMSTESKCDQWIRTIPCQSDMQPTESNRLHPTNIRKNRLCSISCVLLLHVLSRTSWFPPRARTEDVQSHTTNECETPSNHHFIIVIRSPKFCGAKGHNTRKRPHKSTQS